MTTGRPIDPTWHRLSNKDAETMIGDCSVCGPGVPLKWRFHSKGKRVLKCRTKINQGLKQTPAYRRSQEDRWARRPSARHGLTRSEARAFMAGKSCAICGTAEDLVIDHCHTANKIRDVLCRHHNSGLGMFHDSPAELLAAVDYLVAHGAGDPRERAAANHG